MKTKGLFLASKILLATTTFAFPLLIVGGEIAFQNKELVSSFLGQKTQDIIKDPSAANKDHEYYNLNFYAHMITKRQ